MRFSGLMICVAALVAAAPTLAAAQSRPLNVSTLTGGRAAPQVQRALTFGTTPTASGGSLVLPLSSEADIATRGAFLDAADRAAITRAAASARFNFNARQTLSLRGIGAWDRILVVGLGEAPPPRTLQAAGAVAGRALLEEPGDVTVAAAGLAPDAAAEFATGLGIGEYRSDLYHTDRREPAPLGATRVIADDAAAAQAIYARRGRALIDAMAFTRDLSNEPANVVYPETFVQRTRAAFAGVRGVTIQVLDVPAMERLGMGAILGVGRGSSRPPRMLIVTYRGRGAGAAPIVLAGKGITFDSGGLTLKPGANMGNMRMDMSGAASVMGATLALARSQAPVHVVAIAALAENMPDGNAIRPGDVLTAMNGMTIEVVSTDAEGRLVLADALSWVDANLEPAAVLDLATLTGSMNGALGDDYAGLFTRHDALADQIDAASQGSGEGVWRLPLHASYSGDTNSTYADIRNTGDGPGGGMGGYFIGEFIDENIPWAHLDIASVAYGGANDWKPSGSAAWGVRLLERFVLDFQPIPASAED